MKKKYIIAALALACTGLSLSSCSDDLGANYEQSDELYKQMVSFKAPVGDDGVYHIYMRYNADGTGSYNLPVIVSGTANNKRDLDVKIGVDNDTLALLNADRFAASRQDLWYVQLPEQYYTLPSATCHIPAGTNVVGYPIKFNLQGFDANEKYVLPLTIEKSADGSYEQNTRKGWYKALMYVNLFNDYSGTYSSSAMRVYFDGDSKDPATVSTRTCKVVDDKTVFFYAGTVWEEEIDRNKYRILVHFGEGTKQADGSITGPVTIEAADPQNPANIVADGECSYTYTERAHSTKPNIQRRQTTLYLKYKYSDVTADPKNPVRMRVEGSMTMERIYNPAIPDEDQAASWFE